MIDDDLKFLKNLTSQEAAVRDYIIQNPECVFNLTASELANVSYTSASNIVRLCKKLGFNGYQDFRLQYAREYSAINEINKLLSKKSIEEISNTDDICVLISSIYDLAIKNTQSHLNTKQIFHIANKISDGKRLDIYGLGNRYNVALKTCYKFQSIGVNAVAKNTLDFQHLISNKDNRKIVNFILSNSGENKALLEYAEILKKFNLYTCSITGLQSQELANLCDDAIFVDSGLSFKGVGSLFFQTSVEYVLDILYVTCILLDVQTKKEVSYNSQCLTINDLLRYTK